MTEIAKPRSLLDKIWDRHVVIARADGPSLLYIDCNIIHEAPSTPLRTCDGAG